MRTAFEVPPKEGDILVWLLEHGHNIAYQIAKSSDLKQSTVYANLSRLEQKRMVESKELEGKNKTKGEKEYALTVQGLAYAFIESARRKKWSPKADTWAYLLPLIFGKWQLFVDGGFEHDMQERLVSTHYFFISMYVWGDDDLKRETATDRFQYSFYALNDEALDEEFPKELKQLRRLYRISAKDREIHHFITQYLNNEISQLSKKNGTFQSLKEIL